MGNTITCDREAVKQQNKQNYKTEHIITKINPIHFLKHKNDLLLNQYLILENPPQKNTLIKKVNFEFVFTLIKNHMIRLEFFSKNTLIKIFEFTQEKSGGKVSLAPTLPF